MEVNGGMGRDQEQRLGAFACGSLGAEIVSILNVASTETSRRRGRASSAKA